MHFELTIYNYYRVKYNKYSISRYSLVWIFIYELFFWNLRFTIYRTNSAIKCTTTLHWEKQKKKINQCNECIPSIRLNIVQDNGDLYRSRAIVSHASSMRDNCITFSQMRPKICYNNARRVFFFLNGEFQTLSIFLYITKYYINLKKYTTEMCIQKEVTHILLIYF